MGILISTKIKKFQIQRLFTCIKKQIIQSNLLAPLKGCVLKLKCTIMFSSFSMSSPSGNGAFAVVGTVVDSLPDWSLRIYQNCLLAVDQEGSIVFRDETTKQNLDMIKEK